jgi:hypothetical protein
MPGEQLAERHHWQVFYQQAVADDYAHRTVLEAGNTVSQ